jgi:hypothetical protein
VSAADEHPFKVWLRANHVKEDTPVGDLRDVQLDAGFPSEGERQDVRRYLKDVWGADTTFLLSFEEAWGLYEPDGSPADHPFVTFLLHRDLRDGTPLSAFAQEYANLLAATGDRATLRKMVEEDLGYDPDDVDPHTSGTLSCFDIAWNQFRPTCETADCEKAVGIKTSLCGVHALEELL